MNELVELRITKVGSGGDGIGEGPSGPVYVPYTLDGDVVVARVCDTRGSLVEVLEASAEREPAVCGHFTKCGGCALQHMKVQAYLDWKRERVVRALANRGIDVDVGEIFRVGQHGRRRVVLSVATSGRGATSAGGAAGGAGVIVGFQSAGTNTVVDLLECPVASKEIVDVVPRLRRFLEPVVRHAKGRNDLGDIRIHVLSASNGLDISIFGLSSKTPRDVIAQLSKAASRLGAVRVSLGQDPIFKPSDPFVLCGPAQVVPYPGGFLQASQDAERKMIDLIFAAFPKRTKRVADLFCGLGAFSFALATRARVAAYDTDKRAIDALENAQRHTKGIKKIDAKVRDLFQEPLSRKELEDFDVVVFDPPRVGAKSQAANLAKSSVPAVVAVSCNPATFARDARVLIDGGYTLQNVTPIDQFVYSTHVELVAVFRR